jgi:hypothetical protein
VHFNEGEILMAEDLTRMWGKFSLLEEERSFQVEIQSRSMEGITRRGQSCLEGKLLTDHLVSKDIIKPKLVRGWKSLGMVLFKMIGDNLFLLEFEEEGDKFRVLEGRPWAFKGSLFSVEDFDERMAPSQIAIDKAAFWVHMYDLPLACMGQEVGFQIGSSVG